MKSGMVRKKRNPPKINDSAAKKLRHRKGWGKLR